MVSVHTPILATLSLLDLGAPKYDDNTAAPQWTPPFSSLIYDVFTLKIEERPACENDGLEKDMVDIP